MCQNRRMTLTTLKHDRDVAGMTYVYPVVSRRAGGVSLGINLNPNNACNWRCIYCQVPNLKRGGPPAIDLRQLEDELRAMLTEIVHGDFLQREVPEGMRHLNDVALSGNGEPTSAAEFPTVVEIIARLLTEFGLLGQIKLVLITNGSLANRPAVKKGLKRMAELNGEVWFKFDRATRSGMKLVNDTEANPEKHFQRLKSVAGMCPTWLQTCIFKLDGMAPDQIETDAYLTMLSRAKAEALPLRGVLLYGLARPSLQPEAMRLSTASEAELQTLTQSINQIGWPVRHFA